jgi:hypothetical protein
VEFSGDGSVDGGVLGIFVVPGVWGRSRLGESVMANEIEFPEQGAYARTLIWAGVLQRCAKGLIVMGTGTIPMGIWADNVSVVIVGMIGVIGGVVWRLWLYGKKLRGPPSALASH